MIKLSADAKQKYADYVGPDGKLIIDDSLPEDIKDAFKFFNEKNINILELNINDDGLFPEDTSEEEPEDLYEERTYEEEPEEEEESYESSISSYEEEGMNDSDKTELNDFF